jgi:beta-lactamase regulating signal transducer with metallopeptidase domain
MNIIPFSFGKSIYINRAMHSEEELKKIIEHEFVHIKQRHSADMIWAEIFCMLNWYNPFAWLIRKSIRQNLEFIADNGVLESGIDRKQYQYLLLKVTGNTSYSMGNNFNFSSLAKRIFMMNKAKSATIHLVKFLFILPLAAVMILAFRSNHQNTESAIKVVLRDTQPVPAIKPAAIPKEAVQANPKKKPAPEVAVS